MIYAGIDYSLNCPAMCIYNSDDGDFSHQNCRYYYNQNNISHKEQLLFKVWDIPNIYPKEQYHITEYIPRYIILADWFISILMLENVSIVAMEDYAIAAQGKVFNIAECTMILKSLMFSIGLNVYRFPPTTVKKYFCGKGNANKDLMVEAYNQKYNVDIMNILNKKSSDSPVSDIVDSHAMLYTYFKEQENGNRSSN